MIERFNPDRHLCIALKHEGGAMTIAYRDDEQELWMVYRPLDYSVAYLVNDEELADMAYGINN